MSLDVSLTAVRETEVYTANITHNLTKMADKAGIYKALWCPEEIDITKAEQLIKPLEDGLAKLKADPAYYQQFDAPNGWGRYVHFVPFVKQYLEACRANPDAMVRTSR